jgi:alanine-glyoxylate transaminase/serine-glyoxylate transaminase/serine-pyruvate transaminase
LLIDIGAVTAGLGRDRPLVALDAVASVGSERVQMDLWGIDLLAGAGQKALAAPAGVSFVIASQRAREAAQHAGQPRYYFSFERLEAGESTGDTPFTPAIAAVQLMHDSLRIIEETGVERVLERHERCSEAVIGAFSACGLRSFPERPSCSVQAFLPPEGMDANELIEGLAGQYGILCAGGQDRLKGKIIRVGFPGIYSGTMLERLVRGLWSVLRSHGSTADLSGAMDRLAPVSGIAPLF